MNTNIKLNFLLIVATFFFWNDGFSQNAREIMETALNLDNGNTQISRAKLTTCRYRKKGKRIKCSEKPRLKFMETVRKDYGPNGKDTRAVTIILKPVGERGIGFLQYDYDEANKNSDQWMYLSALGKVKRIVSGNEDEPKTGSFFGSEITYEDMEVIHLDDYTYKIRAEETYGKRPCWVIESTPTPRRARKSSYGKILKWIDKERFLTLKTIYANRNGKRVKRITFSKIIKTDGIWSMGRMLVNNLETGRMTAFSLESVAYNIEVQDGFLTQRTLTDGVFRENLLRRYRSYLK
ncbi:MAG: outer membrane lipoprotein-sorting protein [Proteobacteria bacterium]|nr:outer membrane lipoprotein-sorting protein [Pseudomonadota bacterium]